MDAAVIRLFARIVVLCALLVAFSAQAQTGSGTTEAQVKAAFLYRFGGFVEWPPAALSADSPFVIAVAGSEAVATELEKLVAGRTVQDRAVVVRRLRSGEPVGRAHILFVGQAESQRLSDIAAAPGSPVLIVTESESALSRGSMINFVAVDNKVRFDVAVAPAERGQLRISSRLLSVARKVVS